MADLQENQYATTDFTRGGSGIGNFSLSRARVMAVRTAQATPTRGRWILRRKMLFEVLSDSEDEGSYTVVVSFCPVGDFEGTPGQEQFRFSKTGRFEDREALRNPKHSKRFRIKRRTVVVGVVAVGVLILLAIIFRVLFGTQGCSTRPFCDGNYPLPTQSHGTTTSPWASVSSRSLAPLSISNGLSRSNDSLNIGYRTENRPGFRSHLGV